MNKLRPHHNQQQGTAGTNQTGYAQQTTVQQTTVAQPGLQQGIQQQGMQQGMQQQGVQTIVEYVPHVICAFDIITHCCTFHHFVSLHF